MCRMKYLLPAVVVLLTFVAGPLLAATKDEVVKRGYLQCGVSTGVPGFSNPDEQGNWMGLDVDVCRAVAAATLGDAAKVKFIPLTAKERFTALQSGAIDILASNTTWTFTRDSALGVHFAGISYYDGQGFLVAGRLGAHTARELNGTAICVKTGTTTELNLADYFAVNNMEFVPVFFDTSDQMVKGFEAGRCDVLTSDQSQLYAFRLQLTEPEAAVVLPEIISKEPQGPVVRQGDDAWYNIVKWSLFVMIIAEEQGITSDSVDSLQESSDPRLRRFAGLEGIRGQGLGLKDDWAVQIVRQVGNYGEVFERNLGQGSPLKIGRGLNDLWTKGGLHYAPPLR